MDTGLDIGDAAKFAEWAPPTENDAAAASEPVTSPVSPQQSVPAKLRTATENCPLLHSTPSAEIDSDHGSGQPCSLAVSPQRGTAAQANAAPLLSRLSESDLARPPVDSDDDVRPGDSILEDSALHSPDGTGFAGGSHLSVQGGGGGDGSGGEVRQQAGEAGASPGAGPRAAVDAPPHTWPAARRKSKKRRRPPEDANVIDLT